MRYLILLALAVGMGGCAKEPEEKWVATIPAGAGMNIQSEWHNGHQYAVTHEGGIAHSASCETCEKLPTHVPPEHARSYYRE